MPRDSAHVLQLPLFVRDPIGYPEALARYEAIRPIFKGDRSLQQQSQQTGMHYWRLWRDLRRFRSDGLLGLIDRRTLPHARGKPGADVLLPRHIQQPVVRLAIAHAFTARELARVVRDGYHYPVEHRGIQRVLEQHHLAPEALQRHRYHPLPEELGVRLTPHPAQATGRRFKVSGGTPVARRSRVTFTQTGIELFPWMNPLLPVLSTRHPAMSAPFRGGYRPIRRVMSSPGLSAAGLRFLAVLSREGIGSTLRQAYCHWQPLSGFPRSASASGVGRVGLSTPGPGHRLSRPANTD